VSERLFNVSPQYRSVFPQDCQFDENGKLVNMLQRLCDIALKPDIFAKFTAGISRSHFQYGVLPIELGEFGNCIFWTFSECLNLDFSDAALLAWHRVMSHILRALFPKMYALTMRRNSNPGENRRERMQTIETARSALSDEEGDGGDL
jgi:hemoglobin-like flavoprotein